MRLTGWQRLRRRIALLGGSYTHPDGTVELDFHEKADIDPTVDSEEVQSAKMERYFGRQRSDGRRNWGAGLIALAVMIITVHFGMPTWQAILVAMLAGFGLYLLATGRWPN